MIHNMYCIYERGHERRRQKSFTRSFVHSFISIVEILLFVIHTFWGKGISNVLFLFIFNFIIILLVFHYFFFLHMLLGSFSLSLLVSSNLISVFDICTALPKKKPLHMHTCIFVYLCNSLTFPF